jgi:hypothetical protein
MFDVNKLAAQFEQNSGGCAPAGADIHCAGLRVIFYDRF